MLLAWSLDGISFTSQQKTSSHLFRLNPASKAIEPISHPASLASSQYSFTKDYKQAAFVAAGPNEYTEVYVSPLSEFTPQKLTAMSEQFKDFQLAKREVVQWKSTDGTAIEGVLIKPANFDATKQYPL